MAITKQERKERSGDHNLSLTIPPLFRCPISLDVMKSPVSLSTGVTYDRASIQRWIDSGNATCPATMQPLASLDLTPNLTLHRLINLWNTRPARALLNDLPSNACSSLRRLNDFFRGDENDEFEKNQLISHDKCADVLLNLMAATDHVSILQEIADVLTTVLNSEAIDKENKRIVVNGLIDRNLSMVLVRLLKEGNNNNNTAVLIDAILSNASMESKVSIAERNEELVSELIRSIDVGNEAALSCLSSLSNVRKARNQMINLNIVPILARILSEKEEVPNAKAMKIMESISSCREGRKAMCDVAATLIPIILARVIKIGKEGTESAVIVMWCLCCLYRDKRAVEALMDESLGGLTKMLVVMQSGCSNAVREMAGDLLKMFRVGKKGFVVVGKYDTKTTHIMPF